MHQREPLRRSHKTRKLFHIWTSISNTVPCGNRRQLVRHHERHTAFKRQRGRVRRERGVHTELLRLNTAGACVLRCLRARCTVCACQCGYRCAHEKHGGMIEWIDEGYYCFII